MKNGVRFLNLKKMGVIGAAALMALSSVSVVNAEETQPQVETKSDNTLIYNESRDELLYSENADKQVEIGSLAKLMTSYILIDKIEKGKLSLKQSYKISTKAWKSDFPKMYLEVGQTVTVAELLEGLLVANGNDAAIQVAEVISGSTEEFSKLMNKYADKLDMKDTKFVSPDGSGGDKSTADDLLKLAIVFNDLPDKYKKYLVQEAMSYDTRPGKPIKTNNGNAFVLGDETITGLSTSARKNNYQAIITTNSQGNEFITIVLDSSTSKGVKQDVYKLLNFGYSSYKTLKLAKVGEQYDKFGVFKSDTIGPDPVAYKEEINAVVKSEVDESKLEYEYEGKEYIVGGQKAGEVLGTVKVYLDDELLGQSEIVTTEDYKKSKGFSAFIDGIGLAFKKAYDKFF